MKLQNSTDFSDLFLRRMLAWVCRSVELPARSIRRAQFTTTLAAFRGRAWSSMRLLVRIGDARHYPVVDHKYPGRVNAPTYSLADRIEALVHVTAHECEHLLDFYEYRSTIREGSTEVRALVTLERFRAHREVLLAEWSEPGRERAPRPSIVERRAVLAAERLEYWQTRLKIATGKVRKYRKTVAYYERRRAATKTA